MSRSRRGEKSCERGLSCKKLFSGKGEGRKGNKTPLGGGERRGVSCNDVDPKNKLNKITEKRERLHPILVPKAEDGKGD